MYYFQDETSSDQTSDTESRGVGSWVLGRGTGKPLLPPTGPPAGVTVKQTMEKEEGRGEGAMRAGGATAWSDLPDYITRFLDREWIERLFADKLVRSLVSLSRGNYEQSEFFNL